MDTDVVLPAYLPSALSRNAECRQLTRGEFLFRHGEAVTHLYFVLAGDVRLIEYASCGTECVLQRAGPGEWLGECSVCVETYSCSARATSSARVAGIRMPEFARTLREDVEFTNAWANQLALSLRRLFGRYERRSLKTARERVQHYLVAESRGQSHLDLKLPLAALAGELGLTPESLYRTLAALEREGAIRRRGGVIWHANAGNIRD